MQKTGTALLRSEKKIYRQESAPSRGENMTRTSSVAQNIRPRGLTVHLFIACILVVRISRYYTH
eukprot:6200609-Pleurochrysis_carterae.AAC.3